MQLRVVTLSVFGLLAAASSGLAHHSHANYVETEFISLSGTVQEVHWLNPHTWIYLQVEGSGEHDGAWALEGASVGTLRRNGWAAQSVAIGTALSVRCHPLKDRSRGCLLGFIVLDDGTEKEFD